MTNTQKVYNVCVRLARKNKHGHMTAEDVFNHLCDQYAYDGTQRQVSATMSSMDVWRKGLPRKFRDGYLLRELPEHIWKKEEAQELRFQLNEVTKAKEAMISEINRLTLAVQARESELAKIRAAWRTFQNLMVERRELCIYNVLKLSL